MNNPAIKVGYLVSYDYNYLKYSLPTVYKDADIIVLAIDKDRKTWKGENFEISPAFFEWIKEYDTENKIQIYEDSFFHPGLTTMECDTRERNMLGEFMEHGGWHVQIDSDEYFIDFESFVNHLKSLDISVTTTVYAKLATIFKQNENEIFMIVDADGYFEAATNNPIYLAARKTIQQKRHIRTQSEVLHQSWGRTEEELSQKLRNWGHNIDFNTDNYLEFWKTVNKYNYKYIHDFHPLNPYYWKSLECIEAEDIPILIDTMRKEQNAEKQDKPSKSKFLSFFTRKKKK